MAEHFHERINYIEFPSRDLAETKAFFSAAFGWQYQDYGSEYVAIINAGIGGGFYPSERCSRTEDGSVLLVLYSYELKRTQEKIIRAGGKIVREMFSFPGGRRFHFSDPSGNEWAVWSDHA